MKRVWQTCLLYQGLSVYIHWFSYSKRNGKILKHFPRWYFIKHKPLISEEYYKNFSFFLKIGLWTSPTLIFWFLVKLELFSNLLKLFSCYTTFYNIYVLAILKIKLFNFPKSNKVSARKFMLEKNSFWAWNFTYA